ncbi:5-oxoprolinase subunit PxpA [Winogradskyella sp. SYSU M77433]|uniref:5-oxoprolinase subunit PxpA n=1 Tax=Winogradskyella sp. SYSU M77433 TaxID=3042722 RepID=UPI0024813B6E|nr:5-oxoprolinase subunit PxpA [Winogradskyella sp. SYSU M77433]MDH7912434.1 5-oxoprolinase subunit PxpA [Winogradskyella sp. SYSU M77433]
MNSKTIDINADVGEGLGNEAGLMPFLSSCNIACGGHAGDIETMTEVMRLANKHYVKIGAHLSFPDKENFGRAIMKLSSTDLYNSLKAQIRSLQSVLQKEKAQLHHVKPHGALYNLAAKDEKTAKVIVEVVKRLELSLSIYAPFNSELARVAKQENIEVVFEAFADRNYNDDLSLVSRQNNDAVISDKVEVLNHILYMKNHEKVKTVNGAEVSLKASTFCVHGDTENALEILRFLNEELPKKNIKIR